MSSFFWYRETYKSGTYRCGETHIKVGSVVHWDKFPEGAKYQNDLVFCMENSYKNIFLAKSNQKKSKVKNPANSENQEFSQS